VLSGTTGVELSQEVHVSTIEEWLASLGMSEYAQRFAENDIDVSVLRHLTDQDLKELGVSLGHRRKMLAAIIELAVGAPPQQAASPPRTASAGRSRASTAYGYVLRSCRFDRARDKT
jgi:SAM domain (Sterile alpha motif)